MRVLRIPSGRLLAHPLRLLRTMRRILLPHGVRVRRIRSGRLVHRLP